jgi:hypothetical protein
MPNLPKQPKPRNPAALRRAWDHERTAARQARADGDRFRECHHLGRAHILSQPLALLHIRTHAAMLGFGIRNRDRREVTGQLLRLLVAGPGTLTRRYPLGNPGGAAVSAVEPMDIPTDLQVVLAPVGAS